MLLYVCNIVNTHAFTVFADVWPRATEAEIGSALCAIGAGKTLNFFYYCTYWALEPKIDRNPCS